MSNSLKEFASSLHPKMRVVENPNVAPGYCLLVSGDGSILFVGPIPDCMGRWEEGCSWFLSEGDFVTLQSFYERYQNGLAQISTTTLQ